MTGSAGDIALLRARNMSLPLGNFLPLIFDHFYLYSIHVFSILYNVFVLSLQ